jgi:hypothetical protein
MRKQAPSPSSGVLIKAAMEYGRLGWSVVPIEARGETSPIRWQVYQHRLPKMTELGDWFNRWPGANLAIVTGVVSALVVLELDPRQDAVASVTRLEQEHAPLPETVEAMTGDGRRHLYFGHPGGIVRERVDLAPGIDLRGDGSYVVAPPSVHACGESYEWVHSPEVFHLVSLPAWLLRAAAGGTAPSDSAPEPWQGFVHTQVPEDRRGDAVSVLCDYLLDKGVDPELATELLLCWNATRCRPPLEADAIVLAVERAAKLRINIR